MYCLFCVVLCIVCVFRCTVLLPPGGYPIAVKYIKSYHRSYYIIPYHKHKYSTACKTQTPVQKGFYIIYIFELHNEELNDLYSSPNIVRVVKSRRMRWVGHVARMGERRGIYRVLVGKPKEKRPL